MWGSSGTQRSVRWPCGKGVKVSGVSEGREDESDRIPCVTDREQYKFMGLLESVAQEDKLVLECAAKEYLRRLSVIWTSPLSDYNRVVASNLFWDILCGHNSGQ